MDTGHCRAPRECFTSGWGRGFPRGEGWGTGRGVLVPPRALTFRGQLEVKLPARTLRREETPRHVLLNLKRNGCWINFIKFSFTLKLRQGSVDWIPNKMVWKAFIVLF